MPANPTLTVDQRRWLTNAHNWGGSFIASFASACFRADPDNFLLLEPALSQLMEKYPKYSNPNIPPKGMRAPGPSQEKEESNVTK